MTDLIHILAEQSATAPLYDFLDKVGQGLGVSDAAKHLTPIVVGIGAHLYTKRRKNDRRSRPRRGRRDRRR